MSLGEPFTYLVVLAMAVWYILLSYFMARICFMHLIDAGRPGNPVRFSIVDIYSLMIVTLVGPVVFKLFSPSQGEEKAKEFLMLATTLYSCGMWGLWMRWVSRAGLYVRWVRFITILYGIVFGSLGPMVAVYLGLTVGFKVYRGEKITIFAWGWLATLMLLGACSRWVARWAMSYAEKEAIAKPAKQNGA